MNPEIPEFLPDYIGGPPPQMRPWPRWTLWDRVRRLWWRLTFKRGPDPYDKMPRPSQEFETSSSRGPAKQWCEHMVIEEGEVCYQCFHEGKSNG